MLKRYLILILFALGLCLPAHATIAFSHSGSAVFGGGTGEKTINITVTINAGDTIVVNATNAGEGVAGAVSSVADNASGGSNTYTKQGTTGKVSSACWTELWTAGPSATAAATTVTVTYASNSQISVTVTTYTGVSSIGNVATPTTGSASNTAPSIALSTQEANDFIAAGFGFSQPTSGTVTISASVGNQRVGTTSTGSTAHPGSANYDNTAASITSVTNTATLSGATFVGWNGVAVVLRAPVAVTNRVPPMLQF